MDYRSKNRDRQSRDDENSKCFHARRRDSRLRLGWLQSAYPPSRARYGLRCGKNNQIGTHQLQHANGRRGQPDNLHIAPRPQDFSEDGLGNGYPSAWRLITENALPFSPIAQELRLVIPLSLVRSHKLHVRRSDIPDRKIRSQRRRRISLQIIPGQYEQAPGRSNSVRLAIGIALAQRTLDPIENFFGKLLGVLEQRF